MPSLHWTTAVTVFCGNPVAVSQLRTTHGESVGKVIGGWATAAVSRDKDATIDIHGWSDERVIGESPMPK